MTDAYIGDLPRVKPKSETVFVATDIDTDTAANVSFSDIAEEIWKQMYEKPVIIRCQWCGSHNAITNVNCISCGGWFG